MGKFVKGSKPTRAERKAQKRAAKATAKQAEFDAKQLAKDEKRAARSGRSLFGFGRKDKEAAENDDDLSADFSLGLGAPSSQGRGFEDEAPAPLLGGFSADPGPSAVKPDEDETIIIDDDIRIIPAKSRQARPTPRVTQGQIPGQAPNLATGRAPLAPEPGCPASLQRGQPTNPAQASSLASFDISTPEGRAAAKRALEQAESGASPGGNSPRAPSARDAAPGSGTLIRPKAAAAPAGGVHRGTEIRPAVPIGQVPNTARQAPSAKLDTQDQVAQSFAALRDAVDKDDAGHVAPLRPSRAAPGTADPEDVLILDDPITESAAPDAPIAASYAGAPGQGQPGTFEGQDEQFPENWLGLWVSEDGQAIFIEDDSDGWHAVTVLIDPTTKCFHGPDYPEIQTFRMPAVYGREEIGDFVGERFSVITVPGLPDDHRSPIMFLYFLKSIPASQGGGNRFATDADVTNRVFLVADFELGTVNPWSEGDDIEWIDPGVNFYKAPGKLDAYMARRMMNEDPLN